MKWLQVYGPEGTKDYRGQMLAREAAIVVGTLGVGATIRVGKVIVWLEGTDVPMGHARVDLPHVDAVLTKLKAAAVAGIREHKEDVSRDAVDWYPDNSVIGCAIIADSLEIGAQIHRRPKGA